MKRKLPFFLLAGLLSAGLQAAELGELDTEQLGTMQQNQNALVVDIRTPQEWQATGLIPGSHKLQSFDADGKFDQQKWLADLEKLKTSPDQPVILVCRSGNRSTKVGKMLSEQPGMPKVYHLNNGIQSWIRSGRPVAPDCLASACN
ncbi:rhodanese-like domain-containing protein [Methylomonas sp. HW2-6]|uniref:rhodanese-like domain-containing protein n=1 Tax=Methylomonas sp. HW2-6 TaxID=3376687 RepID=UPI00404318F7